MMNKAIASNDWSRMKDLLIYALLLSERYHANPAD